jgi:hypothetical protein
MEIAAMGEAAEDSGAETGHQSSKQDIERLLLDSAGVLQRLIAERNALRSRAEAQERQLTLLRRNVALIHDSYRRLTTEFMTQFQLIDSAVGSFVSEPGKPTATLAEDQDSAPNA